ncbi:MAG: DUF4271 domain-containing protein [Schleiferiaceae bacterium]|nr:DUF4271 domain-containing protein [Schleiferiaceae bacterium]
MESGLPPALEGTLRVVPSDALFWLAVLLSLALGLLIHRAPLTSNRWIHAIEGFTHWEDSPTKLWIPNFLLVALISLLGFLILGTDSIPHLLPGYQGPWYGLYLLPIAALTSQLIIHSLYGVIWDQSRHHWDHWGERFSFLPALWIALPFLLWFIVADQSHHNIQEPFYIFVVLIALSLYVLGIGKAFFRYVSKRHNPWYVAILYLCTLETSPVFWILFFQSYEG